MATQLSNFLLEINNLSIIYAHRQQRHYVVNGINLSLLPGDTLGIVGESGSGKSTLALALMGLLPKTATLTHEKFTFKGTPLPALHSKAWQTQRGRQIGMIFQNPMTCLNPYLNIQQQMTEGLVHHFGLSRKQAHLESEQWLIEVSIPEPQKVMSQYPHELSGGMCQRVMIAMALSLKPTLLIADEPTTALDVETQTIIMELLKKLQQKLGLAFILVSHDIGLISKNSQRAVVMYAGEFVEEGPTSEVLRSPQHPYTQSLLAARPRLHGQRGVELQALAGQAPVLMSSPQSCSLYERCNHATSACQKIPPNRTFKNQHTYRCHLEPQSHAP
jgi:peptide/nickel transport system ATP-binding protein